MELVLEFVEGPFEQDRTTLEIADGDSLVVGRSPRCDIVVKDRYVSGHHFQITNDQSTKSLILRDLDSRHGTRVNGERVPSTAIAICLGDEVQFGKSRIRVLSDEFLALQTEVETEPPSILFDQGVQRNQQPPQRRTEEPHYLVDRIISIKLGIVSGVKRPRDVIIRNGQQLIVGASNSSDYTLEDVGLAPQHFKIVCEDKFCSISTLSGSAKIKVNGQEIEKENLFRGDVISAGMLQIDVDVNGASKLTARSQRKAVKSDKTEPNLMVGKPARAKVDLQMQDNGIYAYAGSTSELAPYNLLSQLRKHYDFFVIADPSNLKAEVRDGLPNDRFLFALSPEEARKHSSPIVLDSSSEALSNLLDEYWEQGALVSVFWKKEDEPPFNHLQLYASAFLSPGIARPQFRTVDIDSLIDPMAKFEFIFVEDEEPGRWVIFALKDLTVEFEPCGLDACKPSP